MFSGRKAPLTIILFIALTALGLATGCSRESGDLSERGEEELVRYIENLTGQSVVYEISSVEKAPGYSDSEDMSKIVNFTGDSNAVSGCPEDGGGRDMWCIVLDREVTSTRGNAYSHFLVQRLSGTWYVDELSATEMDEFTELGCQNWNGPLASHQ
jgi:hypothetical protein